MPDPKPPPITRRHALQRALACAALPVGGAGSAHAAAAPSAVTLALSQEPTGLDPTMEMSAATGQVTHYNVFEGLTRIEENASVSPLLAQSWELSADARHCLLRLRPHQRFHDGRPLDAATVRFSFERAGAPGSTNKARRTLFDNIAHLVTPDAHSIALTLHHPDPHLLFRLGESPAVVLHPDSAAHAGSAPVGTGPYRVAQWQRGHSLQLARVPGQPRSRGALAQATFRFLPDPTEHAQALRSGSIDLFFQIASSATRVLHQDTRYQLLLGRSSGKAMLALNHRKPWLRDLRVRRALAHAIDRTAFVRDVMGGSGTPIGSHFAPSDPGFLHLEGLYPYDPERARRLLDEAGGAHPPLTLTLPPAPYAHLGGPVIAQALAAVGITVTQRRVSWQQWLAAPFADDADLTLISHVEPLDYAIYADPNYYFGYDNADFRALMQRYGAATQVRERHRLFASLQRFLAQDAANVWLYSPLITTVARKGLRGQWMHYPIFAHDIGALRWS